MAYSTAQASTTDPKSMYIKGATAVENIKFSCTEATSDSFSPKDYEKSETSEMMMFFEYFEPAKKQSKKDDNKSKSQEEARKDDKNKDQGKDAQDKFYRQNKSMYSSDEEETDEERNNNFDYEYDNSSDSEYDENEKNDDKMQMQDEKARKNENKDEKMKVNQPKKQDEREEESRNKSNKDEQQSSKNSEGQKKEERSRKGKNTNRTNFFGFDYEEKEQNYFEEYEKKEGKDKYEYEPSETCSKFDKEYANGEFQEYMKQQKYKPATGQWKSMNVTKCDKVKTMTVMGMGFSKGDCPAKAKKMAESAAECVAKSRCESAHFVFPAKAKSNMFMKKFMQCFYEACTPQNSYFSDADANDPFKNMKKATFTTTEDCKKNFQKMKEEAAIMATAVCYAKQMSTAPANYCTPANFVNVATAMAQKANMECKVMDQKDCEAEKMGAFMAATKGSYNSPKFMHMKYTPKGSVKHTMAFCGCGMTYDSGGYNMKKGEMERQKFDMAGAAAAVAAAYCVAMMKPKYTECNFFIAAGENMVSGKSFKAGDVVTACDGTTIEVNTTDSAASMAMCDTVAYAKKYTKAQCFVEMSSTGNDYSDTMGENCAPAYCSNSKMATKFMKSSFGAGEFMWPMPFAKKSESYGKSFMADKSTGQKKTSKNDATFVKSFSQGTPFVHVEMGKPTYKGYSNQGTGFGVCTYYNYVKECEKECERAERKEKAKEQSNNEKVKNESAKFMKEKTFKPSFMEEVRDSFRSAMPFAR